MGPILLRSGGETLAVDYPTLAAKAGYFIQEYWPMAAATLIPMVRGVFADLHSIAQSFEKLTAKLGADEIDLEVKPSGKPNG